MDQNCHVPVALSSFVTCTNMLQDWRDQEAQVTSRGLSTHDSLSPSPWCYLIPLAPGFIWPESIVTGVTLCRKLFLLGYGRQLHLSSLLAGVSLFTVCNGERGKRPVSLIAPWPPFHPSVLGFTSRAACGTLQQDLVIGLPCLSQPLCASGYMSALITPPKCACRTGV